MCKYSNDFLRYSEPIDSTVPTLGFSSHSAPVLNSNLKNVKVDLLDLGGSESMRPLWANYFSTAHGFIFLLDSSNEQRLPELKQAMENVLGNVHVQEKPILL